MATWDGHLIGGLFLVLQGIWWIVLTLWYSLKAEQKANTKTPAPLRQSEIFLSANTKTGCSKSWIPQPFFPSVPMEPIAKIVACSIGIFSETFLSLLVEEKGLPRRVHFGAFKIFNSSGDFVSVDKFQHVSMYSGFVFSGIVDLFVLFASLPQATSPLFFTLAFVCQGVLFWFHMGHSVLNGTYHKLHLVTVIACMVFSGMRTKYMKSVFINIGLGCSIFLQGTWFFQASFLIYKDGKLSWELHKEEPHSDKLKHMVPMYLSGVFTWHIMLAGIIVLIVWSILYFVVKKSCIIKLKKSNWQALPTDYEKLIDNSVLVDGNVGMENDTEL